MRASPRPRRDAFASCHPLVNFEYFLAVLLFSMFFMHPVFLVISLLCSFVYSIWLSGAKAVRFNCLFLLPTLLLMAALNPLWNHDGMTVLFYLNDNPWTLESLAFGLSSAIMLITVVIWFSCYNAVMTSDKFLYLFGRILPSVSLLFSMVLRFVPRYKAQLHAVSNAQKCIGRDVSQGSLLSRARHGLGQLSILTTWALENAMETADSMRARGYGLPGRTSFSRYRMDGRDRLLLAVQTGLIAVVLLGAGMGENSMQFFPTLCTVEKTGFSYVVYAAYLALCLAPMGLNVLEELLWRRLQSNI